MMNRRQFVWLTTAAAGAAAEAEVDWGGPVIDIHCHLRRSVEDNLIHNRGCGVSHAQLLTREDAASRAREAQAKMPDKFRWSVSTDVRAEDAEARIRAALKTGAIGIGELKSHVEADGPELRRMYALAAEAGVPVLVHFQEVDHFPGEGKWSSGFKRFAGMLKAYPKTKFVGHADAFWANVSADYVEQAAYPTGPIKRTGLTDRLLADYPNMYGDLSANSGNNALSRDAEFTREFLKRHQDKLMFGSDCSCTDGKGGGVGQQNNPTASRMAGKCVARETLTLLKGSTTPEVFRKLVWGNTRRIYGWG
jgi:predicted TIM-barrel fold metal-dependent hydrolase